jgi:hypothetical protein
LKIKNLVCPKNQYNKLRLSRFSVKLKFQDGPSVAIDDCEIVDDVNIDDTAPMSYGAAYTRM